MGSPTNCQTKSNTLITVVPTFTLTPQQVKSKFDPAKSECEGQGGSLAVVKEENVYTADQTRCMQFGET